MKKRTKLLLVAGLAGAVALSLAACDKKPTQDNNTENTQNTETTETTEATEVKESTEAATENSTEASDTGKIYASEIFENGGFEAIVVEKDASILFSLSSQAAEANVTWTAYVYNGEFPDAIRYISQADDVVETLEMSGEKEFTLEVKAGQVVYLTSSENPLTLGGAEEVTAENYLNYYITNN